MLTARKKIVTKPSLDELREAVSLEVPGMSPGDFDEMAIPSHLHPNPLIRWLMWRRYELIAKICKFQSDQHVLEFGCGSGIFLPTLARNCGAVYAVDLFPQFAERLARRRGLDIRFSENVSSLADHSLDIVIAADVLEHFDDPSEILAELSLKLKPGGRLIISGPTENLAYRIGRVLSGFGDKGDYHHTNIHALVRLIEKFGFVRTASYSLPFRFLPHLFRIVEFRNPS